MKAHPCWNLGAFTVALAVNIYWSSSDTLAEMPHGAVISGTAAVSGVSGYGWGIVHNPMGELLTMGPPKTLYDTLEKAIRSKPTGA